MTRRSSGRTRSEFCIPIAKALREFGYPSVTHQQIGEVLNAWIDGKRGSDLPHGAIGMLAGRRFDEIEEMAPGRLKLLPKD